MRPEISYSTKEKIEEWIENNPETGIKNVGPAIDHLIPKAIQKHKEESKKYDRENLKQELLDEIREELG